MWMEVFAVSILWQGHFLQNIVFARPADGSCRQSEIGRRELWKRLTCGAPLHSLWQTDFHHGDGGISKSVLPFCKKSKFTLKAFVSLYWPKRTKQHQIMNKMLGSLEKQMLLRRSNCQIWEIYSDARVVLLHYTNLPIFVSCLEKSSSITHSA